jgi:copine 1/2/3
VVGAENQLEADIFNHKGERAKNFTGIQFSKIIARCDEVMGVNEVVHLTVSGRDLDRKKRLCCGLADSYLEIYKRRNDVQDEIWQKVYTSELVRNSINPRFSSFTVGMHSLCNNDEKRHLMFKVMHKRRFLSPQLIGQGKTTFNTIRTMVKHHAEAIDHLNKSDEKINLRGQMLPLIHPVVRESVGPKYKNSGILLFHKLSISNDPSFLDYVQSGLNLRLLVAIDFTASNGNPRDPSSLHYIDPTGQTMNKYEKALQTIGNIVIAYDSDQLVPVWGFVSCKESNTNKQLS